VYVSSRLYPSHPLSLTTSNYVPTQSERSVQRKVVNQQHKRLRERIWILPIPPLTTPKPKPISTNTTNPTPSPSTPFTPPSPARTKEGSLRPKTKSDMGPPPLPPTLTEVGVDDPLDVEFDQLWEGGSDLDPDDLERMKEYVDTLRGSADD